MDHRPEFSLEDGHAEPRQKMRLDRTIAPALLVLVLWIFGGCASFPGGGGPTLEEKIEAVILAEPLHQVHWGILVVDPDRGRVLYSRSSHRKFVPASNMKVLSTSTALSLLGPEYRFSTQIWGVGPFDPLTGILDGDLVVQPSGDPTLSERFYPTAEAPLDSLALGLWRSGLRSVTGSLVVDVSRWDSTTVPDSWMVGNLPSRSAATGSALSIGEGELVVEVTPGARIGDTAQARWWPQTEADFFSVAFVTSHPDSSLSRDVFYRPEGRRLHLEGSVPLGTIDTLSVAQRDPEGVASWALRRAIEKKGISMGGDIRVVWSEGEPLGPGVCRSGRMTAVEEGPEDPSEMESPGPMLPHCVDATPLAELSSPPMGEVVEAILEPSQNWMTEQLVHALGLELGEMGSWAEGFRVEQEFLTQEVGIDSLDIHYRDGSGLAAYNLVTPRAMVRILEYMRNSPHADLFRLAMAEPGEEDSTLRNRLPGLEGRLFAKTGTISHVNSLSGYLVSDGGRTLIFSVLTNGSGLPSSLVRQGIDRVVQIIAQH